MYFPEIKCQLSRKVNDLGIVVPVTIVQKQSTENFDNNVMMEKLYTRDLFFITSTFIFYIFWY